LQVVKWKYFRPYGHLEMIMKKKNLKKLHLAKETLGSMLDSELSRIAGGLRSYLDTCPIKCTTSDYAAEGVDTFGG
jgi:hypothetical protein